MIKDDFELFQELDYKLAQIGEHVHILALGGDILQTKQIYSSVFSHEYVRLRRGMKSSQQLLDVILATMIRHELDPLWLLDGLFERGIDLYKVRGEKYFDFSNIQMYIPHDLDLLALKLLESVEDSDFSFSDVAVLIKRLPGVTAGQIVSRANQIAPVRRLQISHVEQVLYFVEKEDSFLDFMRSLNAALVV